MRDLWLWCAANNGTFVSCARASCVVLNLCECITTDLTHPERERLQMFGLRSSRDCRCELCNSAYGMCARDFSSYCRTSALSSIWQNDTHRAPRRRGDDDLAEPIILRLGLEFIGNMRMYPFRCVTQFCRHSSNVDHIDSIQMFLSRERQRLLYVLLIGRL